MKHSLYLKFFLLISLSAFVIIPLSSQVFDNECKPFVVIVNNSACDASVYVDDLYVITLRPKSAWSAKVPSGITFYAYSMMDTESMKAMTITNDCIQYFDFNLECTSECDPGVVVNNSSDCEVDIHINNEYHQTIEAGVRQAVIAEVDDVVSVISVLDPEKMVESEVGDICDHEISFDYSCGPYCYEMSSTSFESDMDIWHDGGSDALLLHFAERANTGNFTIRLRDNSGMASSIYTEAMDMSESTEAELEFSFQTVGFSEGESFLVECSNDGGETFEFAYEYTYLTHFRNEEMRTEVISFIEDFSENTVFRIRSDASSNADRLYLDDITLTVCSDNEIDDDNEDDDSLVEISTQNRNKAVNQIDQRLEIFPSIAQSHINLRYNESLEINTIVLSNINGQLINKYNTQRSTLSIDVSELQSGIYFVTLLSNTNYPIVEKFIKQ